MAYKDRMIASRSIAAAVREARVEMKRAADGPAKGGVRTKKSSRFATEVRTALDAAIDALKEAGFDDDAKVITDAMWNSDLEEVNNAIDEVLGQEGGDELPQEVSDARYAVESAMNGGDEKSTKGRPSALPAPHRRGVPTSARLREAVRRDLKSLEKFAGEMRAKASGTTTVMLRFDDVDEAMDAMDPMSDTGSGLYDTLERLMARFDCVSSGHQGGSNELTFDFDTQEEAVGFYEAAWDELELESTITGPDGDELDPAALSSEFKSAAQTKANGDSPQVLMDMIEAVIESAEGAPGLPDDVLEALDRLSYDQDPIDLENDLATIVESSRDFGGSGGFFSTIERAAQKALDYVREGLNEEDKSAGDVATKANGDSPQVLMDMIEAVIESAEGAPGLPDDVLEALSRLSYDQDPIDLENDLATIVEACRDFAGERGSFGSGPFGNIERAAQKALDYVREGLNEEDKSAGDSVARKGSDDLVQFLRDQSDVVAPESGAQSEAFSEAADAVDNGDFEGAIAILEAAPGGEAIAFAISKIENATDAGDSVEAKTTKGVTTTADDLREIASRLTEAGQEGYAQDLEEAALDLEEGDSAAASRMVTDVRRELEAYQDDEGMREIYDDVLDAALNLGRKGSPSSTRTKKSELDGALADIQYDVAQINRVVDAEDDGSAEMEAWKAAYNTWVSTAESATDEDPTAGLPEALDALVEAATDLQGIYIDQDMVDALVSAIDSYDSIVTRSASDVTTKASSLSDVEERLGAAMNAMGKAASAADKAGAETEDPDEADAASALSELCSDIAGDLQATDADDRDGIQGLMDQITEIEITIRDEAAAEQVGTFTEKARAALEEALELLSAYEGKSATGSDPSGDGTRTKGDALDAAIAAVVAELERDLSPDASPPLDEENARDVQAALDANESGSLDEFIEALLDAGYDHLAQAIEDADAEDDASGKSARGTRTKGDALENLRSALDDMIASYSDSGTREELEQWIESLPWDDGEAVVSAIEERFGDEADPEVYLAMDAVRNE